MRYKLIADSAAVMEDLSLSEQQKIHAIKNLLQDQSYYEEIFHKNQKLVDRGGKFGWTILGIAAKYNQAEIIKWLITEEGANINLGKEAGITPLRIAICYLNLEAVKMLLKLGADPNLSPIQLHPWNADDKTSLEIAKWRKEREIAQNGVKSPHLPVINYIIGLMEQPSRCYINSLAKTDKELVSNASQKSRNRFFDLLNVTTKAMEAQNKKFPQALTAEINCFLYQKKSLNVDEQEIHKHIANLTI